MSSVSEFFPGVLSNQPARRSPPEDSAESGTLRALPADIPVKVVVVDEVDTVGSTSDQLRLEGFDVAVCKRYQAQLLLERLTRLGAEIILIDLYTSPLAGLAMLRAAVTVCRRLKRTVDKAPVVFLMGPRPTIRTPAAAPKLPV
ncbi:MAG: hypothetical protein HY560_06575 [Gemmatimonadetes bacterium]|nr:hypothetical protein [Gemmatimonadota bacterium]